MNRISLCTSTQHTKLKLYAAARLRHHCMHANQVEVRPPLHTQVLRAVPWSSRESVAEAYALLSLWAPIPPDVALQLLDSHFPDPKVRAHAVAALESWQDDTLSTFSLQLTQVCVSVLFTVSFQ